VRTTAALIPLAAIAIVDNGLGYYNKVHHYNRAAIGGLLQVAGGRHDVSKDVPRVDVEENTVVGNHVDDM
jgi:hypothetical protein